MCTGKASSISYFKGDMSRYLSPFRIDKTFFASIEFHIISIYRHLNCSLSSVAMNGKDGHGLKLEKIAPTFSGFNAIPAKLSKKLILLLLSDKIYVIFSS